MVLRSRELAQRFDRIVDLRSVVRRSRDLQMGCDGGDYRLSQTVDSRRGSDRVHGPPNRE